MKELVVKEYEINQRIDKFIFRYLNIASKSFIYKMFRKKNIKLNNVKIKGNEILKIGDKIQLYLSDETIKKFKEKRKINMDVGNLDIIYEDDNILFINKPKNILSHPNSKETPDTIIDRILLYLNKKGELNISNDTCFMPGICNRLDRNTSGIIICGKNLPTTQALNKLSSENNLNKYYLVIVKGKIDKEGKFVGYHVKNKKTNEAKVFERKVNNSKEIITEYKPIKYNNDFTLLNVRLVTGKFHQIRAHLKSRGYSIVGDKKYGDKYVNDLFYKKFNIDNQMLHAFKIKINSKNSFLSYLNGKEFIAKLPNEFELVKKYLF